MRYRIEKDLLGQRQVPAEAYYGIETLRGKENFEITKRGICRQMIKALAIVKKAAAKANVDALNIDEKVGKAIMLACDEILNGRLHGQFVTDLIQGGAGTSMNMNANEVIANRANELLGGKKGVKKSAITNNYTEISNKIYSYLDSSSYKELSDYSDEIDALDNKAFDKEYSVLMGVRYYVWSVGFMNTNDSDNYNLTQSDVSNLAYYLSQFYYYTQLSAYKDKEVTMTSDNEKYLNKMREDMGVLLKKYYHITDEDLEAIDTFSSARIEQCLIQRG